jgi:peptidoglycan hydrolase-like protein with peptidoglycan-binding domain
VDAAAAPLGHETSDEDQSRGGERGDAAPAGDAFVPPRSLPAPPSGSANVGAAAGARDFGGGGPAGPTGPSGPNLPARRGRLGTVVGIAAAVVGLVIAGGIYLYVQKPSPARAAGGHPAKTHSPVPKGPEHVVSITPADGTTAVNGGADIRVEFSAPLSPTSPMPTLKPAIDGTWLRDGNSAVFVPDRGFRPRTKVTIRVPASSTGVTSTGGGLLAAPVTAKFRIGKYNGIRMEQLLAQLGYLPLTWSPLSGSSPAPSDARAQVSAAYEPPAGTYTWQTGYPSRLTRLWRPDRPSLILKGAVMAFEADHHLTLDGVIGSQVWRAMFKALAKGQMNTHGYSYAVASQKLPETLTVWHNGQVIFHHLANTGIPVAPTAVGTDPVYLRYRSQIMRGRNPDGTKYADPVAWVAYFHGGEAVHYFPRYSYGSQQSLGCVELPYKPAKRIWPYLTFGTLVTVTAP